MCFCSFSEWEMVRWLNNRNSKEKTSPNPAMKKMIFFFKVIKGIIVLSKQKYNFCCMKKKSKYN